MYLSKQCSDAKVGFHLYLDATITGLESVILKKMNIFDKFSEFIELKTISR